MSQPYTTPPGGEPNPYGWAPGAAAPGSPAYPAPYPYPYPYPPAPVQPTNGLAIAAMVVSIAAFVVCGGVLGIVGAILGHVARRQIRERGGQGDGMALAGIIIGWIGFAIGLVVIAFYIWLVVIAVRSGDTGRSSDFGDVIATVARLRGLLR